MGRKGRRRELLTWSGKCFLLSRLKFLYLFLSLSFSSSWSEKQQRRSMQLCTALDLERGFFVHPAHARPRLRRRRKCTKNTADGFYFAVSRRVLSRKICAHLLHTLSFPCFTQCTLFSRPFNYPFPVAGGGSEACHRCYSLRFGLRHRT